MNFILWAFCSKMHSLFDCRYSTVSRLLVHPVNRLFYAVATKLRIGIIFLSTQRIIKSKLNILIYIYCRHFYSYPTNFLDLDCLYTFLSVRRSSFLPLWREIWVSYKITQDLRSNKANKIWTYFSSVLGHLSRSPKWTDAFFRWYHDDAYLK